MDMFRDPVALDCGHTVCRSCAVAALVPAARLAQLPAICAATVTKPPARVGGGAQVGVAVPGPGQTNAPQPRSSTSSSSSTTGCQWGCCSPDATVEIMCPFRCTRTTRTTMSCDNLRPNTAVLSLVESRKAELAASPKGNLESPPAHNLGVQCTSLEAVVKSHQALTFKVNQVAQQQPLYVVQVHSILSSFLSDKPFLLDAHRLEPCEQAKGVTWKSGPRDEVIGMIRGFGAVTKARVPNTPSGGRAPTCTRPPSSTTTITVQWDQPAPLLNQTQMEQVVGYMIIIFPSNVGSASSPTEGRVVIEVNGKETNKCNVTVDSKNEVSVAVCAVSLVGSSAPTQRAIVSSLPPPPAPATATATTTTTTIPATREVEVFAWGAAGGAANTYKMAGGPGGFSTARMVVKTGAQLTIMVGQGGAGTVTHPGCKAPTTRRSFGGGGSGGCSGGTSYHCSGGGGGGCSAVMVDDVPLVVAGGGGGSAVDYQTHGYGGGGGGETGSADGDQRKRATQEAPGGWGDNSPQCGGKFRGGDGADVLTYRGDHGGGGGGGGLYGGGGGHTFCGGADTGGGGGCGYVVPRTTAATANTRSGSGIVSVISSRTVCGQRATAINTPTTPPETDNENYDYDAGACVVPTTSDRPFDGNHGLVVVVVRGGYARDTTPISHVYLFHYTDVAVCGGLGSQLGVQRRAYHRWLCGDICVLFFVHYNWANDDGGGNTHLWRFFLAYGEIQCLEKKDSPEVTFLSKHKELIGESIQRQHKDNVFSGHSTASRVIEFPQLSDFCGSLRADTLIPFFGKSSLSHHCLSLCRSESPDPGRKRDTSRDRDRDPHHDRHSKDRTRKTRSRDRDDDEYDDRSKHGHHHGRDRYHNKIRGTDLTKKFDAAARDPDPASTVTTAAIATTSPATTGEIVHRKYDNGEYHGDVKGDQRHGTGTFVFKDGSCYQGTWIDDTRCGTGTHTWPNGDTYRGSYADNKRHGRGVYKWSDGGVYDGQWVKDVECGYGKHFFPDGSCYEGEFQGGVQNGAGTYTWANGKRYMGEWRNNCLHGRGVDIASRATGIYVGEFVEGIKHGKGTSVKPVVEPRAESVDEELPTLQTTPLRASTNAAADMTSSAAPSAITQEKVSSLPLAPATIRTGEWKSDDFTGRGHEILPDGSVYVGDWNHGRRHGQGILLSSDGKVFCGEFKSDVKTGDGEEYVPKHGYYSGTWDSGSLTGKSREVLSDGTVYIGDLVRGIRHGNGILLSPDGSFYRGQFKNGLISGDGEQYVPNRGCYEGQFAAGQREGEGVWSGKDSTFSGHWRTGLPSGKGEVCWKDGSSYQGDWVNGSKEGTGTYKWPNGEVYTGEWHSSYRTGTGVHHWPTGEKYEGQFLMGNFHGKGTFYWPDGTYHRGTWKNGLLSDDVAEHRYTDGRVIMAIFAPELPGAKTRPTGIPHHPGSAAPRPTNNT
ncbi:2-isopropylmalate synthase [Pelomyxa schiedti]|nr:2-isopropylmalate synthase [Pelomyxa schiedti]